MRTKGFLVHALSPLHAGVGQAIDVIDLPIARMKGTGVPFVPGSSIKGVIRDRYREEGNNEENLFAIFGPDYKKASENAGALIVSDALVLAMPVRAFRGTFAWVSSPFLLSLARRDFGDSWPAVPANISGGGALVGATEGDGRSINIHGADENRKVYLEDLDLVPESSELAQSWATKIAASIDPLGDASFGRRFLIVDDDTMNFLLETATQVDTRVRIDEKTGTAARNQLWTEESLPPETLLFGVLCADRSRRDGLRLSSEAVIEEVAGHLGTMQFGGKATVGRGRCRVVLLS